jgi:protoheme ferro-lyase
MAKTGVIFVAHGEPVVFSQEAFENFLKEMFEEFRETGVPVPPPKVIPVMVSQYRKKYEGIDYVSPHNLVNYKLVEKLKNRLPEYDVRLAFLEFVSPTVPEVLLSMVKDGIKKILIVPMLTTISSHTMEIEHLAKEQKLEEKGVQIIFSKPMFYRPELVECLVQRILEAAGNMDKKQIGIALIGHGEPKEWAEKAPLGEASLLLKQEEELKQKVKEKLVELGFDPNKIESGWMEFVEPDTPTTVKKVASKLVKKIIVVPTSVGTDAVHTLYDVPQGAMSAEIPPEIRYFSQIPEIQCLKGSNDHPLMLKALESLVREALGDDLHG